MAGSFIFVSLKARTKIKCMIHQLSAWFVLTVNRFFFLVLSAITIYLVCSRYRKTTYSVPLSATNQTNDVSLFCFEMAPTELSRHFENKHLEWERQKNYHCLTHPHTIIECPLFTIIKWSHNHSLYLLQSRQKCCWEHNLYYSKPAGSSEAKTIFLI